MEEEKENVVEEITTKNNQSDPGDENVVKVDKSKFKPDGDDNVTKVDLNATPQKKEETEVVAEEKTEEVEAVTEVAEETETQEAAVLEEVTEEVEDAVESAIEESEATGKALPESIQKLVDFMEDTGGDINDYVKLNQDYSKLDDNALLKEFYAQTKPHLDAEEINFLVEDTFSFDEDIDDERDIRRKKLALKEQVASAKSHLDGQKSTYYEEIKAGSKLTTEQQKAINFFDRYNKESEVTQKTVDKNTKIFEQKTNSLFNDKFKGFEYDVGDKKYRFNVKDIDGVKATQSDSNNFMTKFVDENSALKDARGYHKSLFTAMNADAVAKHFYEQGKADAMKSSIAKAKNVDMNPRQSHGTIEAGGLKVKVLGDTTSDFKFKIKNK